MDYKTKIKDITRRAYFLNGITEITGKFVETFWELKEELYKVTTQWSNCEGKPYPLTMQEDLRELNMQFEIAWHKICESGIKNY